jgi:hypothetical protein
MWKARHIKIRPIQDQLHPEREVAPAGFLPL